MPRTQAMLPADLHFNRGLPAQLAEALQGLTGAVRLYRNGDYGASLIQLPEQKLARNTAIGDYFLLYRAKALISGSQLDKAIAILQILRKEYPSSPLLTEATIEVCQSLLDAGKIEDARSLFHSSAHEKNAETLYLQARIEEASGKLDGAIGVYLQLYADYATSKHSQKAFDRLQNISPSSLRGRGGYEIQLRRASNLLSAGMSREARSMLTKLADTSAPNKALTGKRLMLLAQSEINLGGAREALLYVNRAIQADPALQAQGLYLKAICYRRLKQENSILDMRNRAVRTYPNSPYTEKLLYSVATYYDTVKKPDSAINAYRQILRLFPRGNYSETALWKEAFYSYLDRKHEEALNRFWRYLQSYSDATSVNASLYWMGRCYENLRDFNAADSAYEKAVVLGQHGYYGHLGLQARQELKKKRGEAAKLYAGDANWLRVQKYLKSIPATNSDISVPSPALKKVIERAGQLKTAGLAEYAITELNRAIRQFPEEKGAVYFCARISIEQGDYDTAFRTLRRAFPEHDSRSVEDLPEEVWALLYPMKHWDTVNKEAAANKLDPVLIMGLIRQESAFNEKARSPADARGLMQILPSTGRMLARNAGVQYSSSKLYHADTNIKLGVLHLSGLMRKYKGKEQLALAAYNAGESRVASWIGEQGDYDLAEFVESIPFSETRNYVKRVMSNAGYYRQLNNSFAGTRLNRTIPETDQ